MPAELNIATLTFAGSGVDSYEVWATPGLSAGRSILPVNKLRFVILMNMADETPIDISPWWVPIFGPLRSGRKVFFRLVAVNARGIKGATLTGSCIIT
jgi:hypothetical protein